MRSLFIFMRKPWKCLVWKVDGGFNGGTVCRRRPYNRVNLGVWFTLCYLIKDLSTLSTLQMVIRIFPCTRGREGGKKLKGRGMIEEDKGTFS